MPDKLPYSYPPVFDDEDTVLRRLARMETRLCMLMMHFGLDPHGKTQPTPTQLRALNDAQPRKD